MKNFRAVITALITPFRGGEVDYDSLGRLIDQQLKGGVEGFVVHGTTAESPTTTESEKEKIFAYVKSRVPSGFPLIVGTGENSTDKTIKNTKLAEAWGADAVLVVVPYYNKPPQRGLFEHFKAVANSTKLPVILYNVPGRTITALELDTIEKLSKVPGIVGIKEASGNIEFAAKIRAACGEKFVLLSGDDGTYDGFLKNGGDGVISVATHVIPREFVQWTQAARDKKFDVAVNGIKKSSKLIDSLFWEANPIPVKKALAEMGVIAKAEMRLPLVEMDEAKAAEMKKEMSAQGLFS